MRYGSYTSSIVTLSSPIDALIALGYTRAEASAAMAGVKDQDLTAEEYIRLALKNLF